MGGGPGHYFTNRGKTNAMSMDCIVHRVCIVLDNLHSIYIRPQHDPLSQLSPTSSHGLVIALQRNQGNHLERRVIQKDKHNHHTPNSLQLPAFTSVLADPPSEDNFGQLRGNLATGECFYISEAEDSHGTPYLLMPCLQGRCKI